MTVAELIAVLQEYDGELEVVIDKGGPAPTTLDDAVIGTHGDGALFIDVS